MNALNNIDISTYFNLKTICSRLSFPDKALNMIGMNIRRGLIVNTLALPRHLKNRKQYYITPDSAEDFPHELLSSLPSYQNIQALSSS